jgi:hypothetical protein
MYGHAERARIAAQRAIAETVDFLLSLPSLNEDQFVQEFAPERLRRTDPAATVSPQEALERRRAS